MKKQTSKASAPKRQSPTKASDAGCDRLGSHKPRHLFRVMSAAEVEELWTVLHTNASGARAHMDRLTTDDGQGVRWMAREEFNQQHFRAQFYDEARFHLVDILARVSARGTR